jgi:hypothetical protein
MRLYKFKELSDRKCAPHFLQIVLDGCIWCASPDSLNDEEEFQFRLDYCPTPRTLPLLIHAVHTFRTTNLLPPELSASHVMASERLELLAAPVIGEMIDKCRKMIGVTSFSMDGEAPHLWDSYGGCGNGACIEIEIPDDQMGRAYHAVEYVDEKIFHVDMFLEGSLNSEYLPKLFRAMLATKTRERWSNEREIRFIGNRQNVKLKFDGNVKSVTFGRNVAAETLRDLRNRIEDHCRSNSITVQMQR